ncbi:MAG TPA: hypothetical protein GXX25_15970 [Desulfotomaculum sp.]|nr:hypothetical protein [Desulfotomaculum sp.]
MDQVDLELWFGDLHKKFAKLPREKKERALLLAGRAARTCFEHLVDKVRELQTEMTARHLLGALGVSLVFRNEGKVGNFVVRAEYSPTEREITIYTDSVSQILEAKEAIEATLDMELTYKNLLELIIWHELFHYLERREMFLQKELSGHPELVGCRKIIEEIAAGRFVQIVTKLPTTPVVIEYILQQQSGEKHA